MTYTINPNAKNVWIRDNEDTMDLSPITDASSVYLENGRTIEQELGEGSMVSNVATVDNSMSKVIDGTLDGAYESGVMYGRSLVNNNNNKFKEIAFNATNTTQATNYALLLDDSAGCPDLNVTMVTGKKYLILEKWTVSSTTGNGHTIQPKIIDKNGDVAYFSGDGQVKGTGTFTLKRTFTPTVDVDKFYFAITNGAGVTVSGTFHYGMIIEYQQGMENWDIPFFEGLCDVKMPILRNVGKNLFDGVLEKGNFNGGTNNIRSSTFTLEELRTYTISNDKNYSANVVFHDDNNQYISEIPISKLPYTFTTPLKTKYVWIRTWSNQDDLAVKFQIEKGSTATSYENHKTNILHTPETVTLRSLPNGVRDELNLKTGEYIKRIGEVVLDGSEDWTVNNINNTTVCYYTRKVHGDGYKVRGGIICDTFTELPVAEFHLSPNEGFFSKHPSHNVFYLVVSKDRASSTSELLNYLSQNPITVQYELAEPITTIIEPLTIPFAYQNGHVILESGYEEQSLLPTLEYSTVVNRTGQVESVAKTIQTQEKQLTMLEQMLIQNIIGLDYNNALLTLNLEIDEVM